MTGLHQVTKKDGTIIECCATTKEIAKMLGRTTEAVTRAATQGYALRGEYSVEKVDITLAKNRDAMLLIQYDIERKRILKLGNSKSPGKHPGTRITKE